MYKVYNDIVIKKVNIYTYGELVLLKFFFLKHIFAISASRTKYLYLEVYLLLLHDYFYLLPGLPSCYQLILIFSFISFKVSRKS